MPYAKQLSASSILLDLAGNDPAAVLSALVDGLIAQNAQLASRREELLEALRVREAQGSTASQGVAIPHVKLPGLDAVTMVLGVHRAGVNFRALDGARVHVFFSVVRPTETADQHLGLLRWIAGIAQHRDFVPFARQASSPEEVIELLSELATV